VSDREKKRLSLYIKKATQIAHPVTRVSNTASIIESALSIVDEQVEKLRLKSNGETLEEREIRTLHSLIKSLVDLSKEEREREKHDKDSEGLSNLTNEQLIELAQKKLADTKKAIQDT
jgi:hypothetical protein